MTDDVDIQDTEKLLESVMKDDDDRIPSPTLPAITDSFNVTSHALQAVRSLFEKHESELQTLSGQGKSKKGKASQSSSSSTSFFSQESFQSYSQCPFATPIALPTPPPSAAAAAEKPQKEKQKKGAKEKEKEKEKASTKPTEKAQDGPKEKAELDRQEATLQLANEKQIDALFGIDEDDIVGYVPSSPPAPEIPSAPLPSDTAPVPSPPEPTPQPQPSQKEEKTTKETTGESNSSSSPRASSFSLPTLPSSSSWASSFVVPKAVETKPNPRDVPMREEPLPLELVAQEKMLRDTTSGAEEKGTAAAAPTTQQQTPFNFGGGADSKPSKLFSSFQPPNQQGGGEQKSSSQDVDTRLLSTPVEKIPPLVTPDALPSSFSFPFFGAQSSADESQSASLLTTTSVGPTVAPLAPLLSLSKSTSETTSVTPLSAVLASKKTDWASALSTALPSSQAAPQTQTSSESPRIEPATSTPALPSSQPLDQEQKQAAAAASLPPMEIEVVPLGTQQPQTQTTTTAVASPTVAPVPAPTPAPQVAPSISVPTPTPTFTAPSPAAAAPARHSALTAKEHTEYLELEKTYSKGLAPNVQQRFFALRAVVAREQEEYRRQLHAEAMASKDIYSFMDSFVRKQVDAVLHDRKKRVVERWPRHYRTLRAIDVSSLSFTKDDPVLTRKGTLLDTGTSLHMQPPSDLTDLASDSPIASTPKRDSVVDDPHVRRLCESFPIDFALSISTLATLCDLHGPEFKEEFTVPFTVVESQGRRTIYMDKPMPPRRLTTRDKNALYFKKVFQRTCIDRSIPPISAPPPPGSKPTSAPTAKSPTVTQPPPAPAPKPQQPPAAAPQPQKISSLFSAVFGAKKEVTASSPSQTQAAAPPPPPPPPSTATNGLPSQRPSLPSSLNVLGQTITPQSSSSPKPEQTVLTNGGGSQPPTVTESQPPPTPVPTAPQEPLEVSDARSYSVFEFGGMHVLFRCGIRGFMKDPKTQAVRMVQPVVKLEYQTQKGLEEITRSEATRMWAHTYVRGGVVFLGRLNVLESNVLMVEHKECPMFVGASSFRPEQSMRVFLEILRTIRPLTPGHYLISHKAKTTKISILKSVEKDKQQGSSHVASRDDVVFDLHEEVSKSGVTNENEIPYIPVSWIPKPNQIPYTFPPRPDPPASSPSVPGKAEKEKQKKGQKQQKQPKKGEKGKKGKKKQDEDEEGENFDTAEIEEAMGSDQEEEPTPPPAKRKKGGRKPAEAGEEKTKTRRNAASDLQHIMDSVL